MLLQLDWGRVILHAPSGQIKQGTDVRVQRGCASQGLEQELADDSTFTVGHHFVSEHCLLDDLSVDLDRVVSLGKLLLAVDRDLIDRVDHVSELAAVLVDDLREVVEHLPHDGSHFFGLSDDSLQQEHDIIFERNPVRLRNEAEDWL